MNLMQAVITALLSGIFSGSVIFAFNERRDRSAMHLTKIETAIETYVLWIELLSRWPQLHFNLFTMDTVKEAQQTIEKHWIETKQYEEKSWLLLNIYLPSETAVIGSVLSVASKFAEQSNELQQVALRRLGMPSDAKAEISSAALAISEAGHAGKERLFSAARTYAHAPFIVRLPKLPLRFMRST